MYLRTNAHSIAKSIEHTHNFSSCFRFSCTLRWLFLLDTEGHWVVAEAFCGKGEGEGISHSHRMSSLAPVRFVSILYRKLFFFLSCLSSSYAAWLDYYSRILSSRRRCSLPALCDSCDECLSLSLSLSLTLSLSFSLLFARFNTFACILCYLRRSGSDKAIQVTLPSDSSPTPRLGDN